MGRRWWFVNGQPLGETAAEADFNHAFTRSGRYPLSVLDQCGQTARLEFSVGEEALSDASAALLSYLQSPEAGTMLLKACGYGSAGFAG